MCVCVCVCVCVRVCVRACVQVGWDERLWVCIYIYVLTCVRVCVYKCMCFDLSVSVCVHSYYINLMQQTTELDGVVSYLFTVYRQSARDNETIISISKRNTYNRKDEVKR